MPSEQVVLAFDTSAAHCAAALLLGDRIVASRVDEMKRGQAEHLFVMLEEVLSDNGVSWSDLTRIGVGIGPGNFTGIRISVASARGLALSLGIPAIGVSTLEVQFHGAPVLASVTAPRDQAYVQPFGGDETAPELVSIEQAKNIAEARSIPLGHALAGDELVREIAQRAAVSEKLGPPAPLYVRAADAAPPRDPAPVILP